jgi:hypothetical protein
LIWFSAGSMIGLKAETDQAAALSPQPPSHKKGGTKEKDCHSSW